MERVAITMDGQDLPIGVETIEIPAQRVGEAKRPYVVALAIAVMTAAITLGALGPHTSSSDVPGVACDPATVIAPGPATTAGTTAIDAPPWWERAAPAAWVDPQTGRLRQAQPQTTRRVVDHRARDR